MPFTPLPQFADYIQRIAPLAQDNYCDFIFQFDEQHYRQRVDMAGFQGGDLVLDAGCGYGQWSAVLAEHNRRVIGIDHNPLMVEAAKIYAERQQLRNVSFEHQALPRLTFPDNSFDYIWCWSVLMFVPLDQTMCEFRRVLKPNGKILIGCLNGIGRWLYKAWHALKPPRNWPVFRACMRSLRVGHRADAGLSYFTPRRCRRVCQEHGFDLVAVGLDGSIDVTGQKRRLPMFPERFLGFRQNLEFIGAKAA
jgi:SAM-dependent methyltransferase